jgi:hypothetical protein
MGRILAAIFSFMPENDPRFDGAGREKMVLADLRVTDPLGALI